jgi:hypothetical protein
MTPEKQEARKAEYAFEDLMERAYWIFDDREKTGSVSALIAFKEQVRHLVYTHFSVLEGAKNAYDMRDEENK